MPWHSVPPIIGESLENSIAAGQNYLPVPEPDDYYGKSIITGDGATDTLQFGLLSA